MEKRKLGRTGLEVTRLGIGLAEIGFDLAAEEKRSAEKVLNTALDRGITFLDTAACYNDSEELIGRAVSSRRDEFVLATKCGHVTGGYEGEPWTAATIRDSIERSLRRLKTDRLDLVQLHSCDVEVLEKGEVIEALEKAREEGKTRFVGYSGDNEAALWAVRSARFDTLQTSFNLVDQKARYELLGEASRRGMGIITKRPIANAAWGAERSPKEYADQYFERGRQMAAEGPVQGFDGDRILLAMGFVAAHPEVDTMIIGTRNPEHLLRNIARFSEELPVSAEAVEDLHRRFDRLGADWPQLG
jgi:aryl-alcohol dehydrogenase-like predicted oxidoreductase